MNIFWLEYTFFITIILGIFASFSLTWLFFLAYRYEKKLASIWRPLGIFLMMISLIIFLFSRKYPELLIVFVVVYFVSLMASFKGINTEMTVKALLSKPAKSEFKISKKEKSFYWKSIKIIFSAYDFVAMILLSGFLIIFLMSYSTLTKASIISVFFVMGAAFILGTNVLQVKRFIIQRKEMFIQNLYPLFGYFMLLLSSLCLALYYLPKTNIVLLNNISSTYGLLFQLNIVFMFGSFLFLTLWAWNFIKIRVSLRIYLVLFAISVLLATLSSLIFTVFVFYVVEDNNYNMMEIGTNSQKLIMEEFSKTALFMSNTISHDAVLVKNLKEFDYINLQIYSEKYLESAEIDRLNFYNKNGQIVSSPSDFRDNGRKISDDPVLDEVLSGKSTDIQVFDLKPAILADMVIVRAISVINDADNNVIGAVEAAYYFDNAFLDYSKRITKIDATLYSGLKISATTLTTVDDVSRWIGTEEINPYIVDNVYKNGEVYRTNIDRLGTSYYSAFSPIRGFDSKIIGMVSVGVPTQILIESVRKNLLDTLYIVSILAVLMALLGNFSIYKLFKNNN